MIGRARGAAIGPAVDDGNQVHPVFFVATDEQLRRVLLRMEVDHFRPPSALLEPLGQNGLVASYIVSELWSRGFTTLHAIARARVNKSGAVGNGCPAQPPPGKPHQRDHRARVLNVARGWRAGADVQAFQAPHGFA